MSDHTTADPVPVKNRVERLTAVFSKTITFVVYAYIVVVEMILLLGFVLLLFGANPTSSFVQWVYRSLGRTMEPFRGIFQPVELGTAGNDVPAVIETSVIFAMVIYGFLAMALAHLLAWLDQRISRIDAQHLRIRDRVAYQDAEARSRGYTNAAAELAALRELDEARQRQERTHLP